MSDTPLYSPITAQDTVILDTDIGSDCDDAGALALLCRYCRERGMAPAAVINDTSNPYGNGAIDAIAAYYGFSPAIGQWESPGFLGADDPDNNRYNQFLSEHFSPRYATGTLPVQGAAKLYRDTLAAAPDHSVVLITIGFLNTAAAALKADPALFAAKVRTVISMAGRFDRPEEREWNVWRDASSARFFFTRCPCPICFCGFELGVQILTGFAEKDEQNPVSMAYALHSGNRRQSWDPFTVDFAFTGEAGGWRLSAPLSVDVADNGALLLSTSSDSRHRFLQADTAALTAAGARIDEKLRLSPLAPV